MNRTVDCIQKHRILFAILWSLVFSALYYHGLIIGFRNSVGDIISIASITLGILGVFLGLLIGQENNKYFEKTRSYQKNNSNVFEYLIKLIRNNFVINLLFIMLTILIDFVPSGLPILFRCISLFIWAFLLLISFWGVFYVVHTIVNLILYKEPSKDKLGK